MTVISLDTRYWLFSTPDVHQSLAKQWRTYACKDTVLLLTFPHGAGEHSLKDRAASSQNCPVHVLHLALHHQ